MTHGKIQEANMKMTHEKPGTHTCLRATDKTPAMIHARDMDKNTIPENVGRNNKIDRFDLSHLAMTREEMAKR